MGNSKFNLSNQIQIGWANRSYRLLTVFRFATWTTFVALSIALGINEGLRPEPVVWVIWGGTGITASYDLMMVAAAVLKRQKIDG